MIDRDACWHKLLERNAWENRVKTDVRMPHDRDKDGWLGSKYFMSPPHHQYSRPSLCLFSLRVSFVLIKKEIKELDTLEQPQRGLRGHDTY
jgi:hypothetical protein